MTIASGAAWESRSSVTPKGGKIRSRSLGLLLAPHADPRVGDHDVGAGDRLDRVGGELDRAAGALRDLARPRHDVGVGREPLGCADDDVHAGGGAGEDPRVAHVAGTVADEGDPDPRQPALVLAHGLQVGEELAGVELVGERVEHRHAGVRRHGDDVALVGRAPHDRRGLAAEDAGDVLDALARPHRGQAAVDRHRVAAELGDAGGERHLGAQGRAVEDQGDRPRAGERLVVERLGLHPVGQVEDLEQLGGRQVVVTEEVAGHGVGSCAAARAVSRTAGRAASRASRSAAVITSGGTNRSRVGPVALRMKPASRPAATACVA